MRSQSSPTPRIEKGCIGQGRWKLAASTSVSSAVSDSTRCGLRIAHSKPTGPPMSWTTRWQRSIPSASIASPVQRASPLQRSRSPRAARPAPARGGRRRPRAAPGSPAPAAASGRGSSSPAPRASARPGRPRPARARSCPRRRPRTARPAASCRAIASATSAFTSPGSHESSLPAARLWRRPLTRSREARKEQRVSEKVVLERDDLRRTLRRIAHEIAEKNPEPERLGDRRHPHPRRGARPPPARPGRRADRGRGADRRPRHLLLPRRRRRQGRPPRSRSSTPPTSTSTSPGARSCWSTTCCSPAAPCGPRSTRSSTTAARSGCSWRCSATAATASCRSAPTTSARTCRPRAASGSTCASRRPTRSTG